MTREKTKEAIRIMQAFADGKQIEYYNRTINKWVKIRPFEAPLWNWVDDKYRISFDQEEPKEKHYRPYTMEEFVEEMHKHDGFVRLKDSTGYGSLITFIDVSIIISINRFSYQELLDDFVWSDDGTLCGKENSYELGKD